MKLIFSFLFLFLIGALGFFGYSRYISPLLSPSIGKLNVKVSGEARQVYMDGQLIGTTPFYATNLRLGNHTIEIKDSQNERVVWQAPVTLTQATLSVINLDLASEKSFSSGEILFFRVGEEGLSVISYPPRASIQIDNKDTLFAPFDKTLSAGVHTLTVKKEGYITREVTVNIEKGYKLNATAYLATDPFGETTKLDGNEKASLFSIFNNHVPLNKDTNAWIEGIKHLQEAFTSSQTRFDACIDAGGKVYILDQSSWDNKVATKAVVNVAYLGSKTNDSLSAKAASEWEKIKATFK